MKNLKNLLLCCCFLFSINSFANVLEVTNNLNAGVGSLRDNIQAAVSGDTVLINISGTITLSTQIGITSKSNVTIIGAYPAHITITPQAGFTGNMFYVDLNSNISFKNIGFIGVGSAVNAFEFASNVGPITFENCLFENWQSSGAMYVFNTQLSLKNCSFFNNQSSADGGAIYVESGALKSTNCTYSGNVAGDEGGAIYFQDNYIGSELTNNTFIFNDAGASGAAVHVEGSNGPVRLLLNAITQNGVLVEQFTDIGGSNLQSEGGNILEPNGASEDFSWLGSSGDQSGGVITGLHSPEVTDGYGLKYYTVIDASSSFVDINVTPTFLSVPNFDGRRAPKPLTGLVSFLPDAGACEYTQLRVTGTFGDNNVVGMLAWAVLQNIDPVNYIEFDIPAGNLPATISPNQLMNESLFTSIIDGYSQTGSQIPGPEATGNDGVLGAIIPITIMDVNTLSYGIQFGSLAANSSVSGLRFTNFENYGIDTDGCQGLKVFGCEFGFQGNTIASNGIAGIHLGASPDCAIGGPMQWHRNVLTGNGTTGDAVNIFVDVSCEGTIIAGNIVGLAPNGMNSILGAPALSSGILNRSSEVKIGIPTLLGGNVVSDLPVYGIYQYGGDASIIKNNIVGLDYAGGSAKPNFNGIVLDGASTNIVVGGIQNTRSRNIVSSNLGANIWVAGSNSLKIIGNYIGTDITGMLAVGSSNYGIEVNSPTAGDVTIGDLGNNTGNLISGNGTGIRFILSTTPCSVLNNYIGLDMAGATVIPGQQYGVRIDAGAAAVAVGLPGEGNVISGHNAGNGRGVRISTGANNHFVQGNKVGTNAAGTAALGNTTGIDVFGDNNTIGGILVNGDGNLISGNTSYGIDVQAAGTGNVIQGNLIGTNTAGIGSLGNGIAGIKVHTAYITQIGGASDRGNVISGNTSAPGIELAGNGSGTIISGNRIGTTPNGLTALANDIGIQVNGDHTATIGGPVGSENFICSNTTGIDITSDGNIVDGNYIGVGVGGATAGLGNVDGIKINSASNLIGGIAGYTNVISNNTGKGVFINSSNGNQINNCLIGYDGFGSAAGNGGEGIHIQGGSNNLIGNTALNFIGGSGANGISMTSNSNNNQVINNKIGNTEGIAGTENQLAGVSILNSSSNIIGSMTLGSGNHFGTTSLGSSAIGLNQADSNIIRGNYIGIDAANNSYTCGVGINLVNSDGNVIGLDWTGVGAENVISNVQYQATIIQQGSDGNILAGNKYGTNIAGTALAQNTAGILVSDNSPYNQIGGSKLLGLGNLISGNNEYGVVLAADSNFVQGNKIGMDISMSNAFNMQDDGVRIESGVQGNLIGGARSEFGNYIDGNQNNGIKIDDSPNNQIFGNVIGGISNSTQAYGILLTGSATQNNTIGQLPSSVFGNYITGNDLAGIFTDDAAASNMIKANVIGLDTTNNLSEYQLSGIQTSPTSGINSIGEAVTGHGNVISGNENGVLIDGSVDQVIHNNIIGLDTSGLVAMPNSVAGVFLASGANGSVVGGTGALNGNTVSGNSIGIRIDGATTTDNDVLGNTIGLNLASTAAVANVTGIVIENQASGNHIGNATIGNTISGNYIGSNIRGAGTTNNKLANNIIGGDFANTYGALITNSATGNFIGEGSASTRNIITANDSVGVGIFSANSNDVIGNYIGVDADGTTVSSNLMGVFLELADNNQIGDFGTEEGNLISGNTLAGIALNQGSDGNILMNNFLGTDFTGNGTNAALPNGSGIVSYGATGNFIGGDWNNNEGNVICGNTDYGILLDSSSTNSIIGNNVGLSKDNDTYIGNGISGILLRNDANANTIGTTTFGEENVITANSNHGIRILNSHINTIAGNLIGNDDIGGGSGVSNGTNNQLVGVQIDTAATENEIVDGNVISGNSNYGIGMSGPGCNLNKVDDNFIGVDASGLSDLSNGNLNILIESGASHNIIGGTDLNIIAGDVATEHIRISGAATDSNIVRTNYINLGLNGTNEFSAQNGIYILGGAKGNIIGSGVSGEGNLIGGVNNDAIQIQGSNFTKIIGNQIGLNSAMTAATVGGSGVMLKNADNTYIGTGVLGSDSSNVITNCHSGVAVTTFFGFSSYGNKIIGNSIYANDEQGIDIHGDDLILPNDTSNANVNNNGLIDHPTIIDAWTCDDGNTHVGLETYLDVLNINYMYTIELYSNTDLDPSLYGEGQNFLGQWVFDPDAAVDTFTIDLGTSLAVGTVLTATITGVLGNTSEFSKQYAVTVAPTYNTPTTITESCLGADNGMIEIFAQDAIESSIDGGVTIYQGLNGDTITAPAGTYQADVMYVNGCIQTHTVVLSAGTPLDFNYTTVDDTCGLGFGSIVIDTVITNTNGGSGNYSFSFNSGSAYLTSIDTTGLNSGTFDIGLVDNTLGCFSNLDQIVIGNVTDVVDESFDFDSFCPNENPVPYNVVTGGGDWTIDNGAGINSVTGQITSFIPGQTYTITYEVGVCDEQHNVIVTANSDDDSTFTYPDFCLGTAPVISTAMSGGTWAILAGPGTQIDVNTGEILNIGGEYTIEYTTNGLCPTSNSDTVFVFDAISAPIISSVDTVYCPDEVISELSTTAVSGNTYTWYDDQLNAVATGANYTPSGLLVGDNYFYLSLENSDGCISDFDSINYFLSDVSTMFAGPDMVACVGSDLVLTAEGGMTYSWVTSDQLIGDFDEQNPLANISIPESFYVSIKDEYGCTVNDTIVVTLDDPANCNVDVYNAFSPNNDGQNDFWLIDGIEGFPVNTVVIFNRWGDKIQEFVNYDNVTILWDGTNKSGNTLPAGTYFYVVEVGGAQNSAGWIQIVK